MGRIVKLAILSVVVLVGLVVVFALYVAVVAGVDIPGLTRAFRAEGEPISPEVIARGRAVEQKINDAVGDKSAFFLELTDAELTDLLLSKIDPETQIRDAEISVTDWTLAPTICWRTLGPMTARSQCRLRDARPEPTLRCSPSRGTSRISSPLWQKRWSPGPSSTS